MSRFVFFALMASWLTYSICQKSFFKPTFSRYSVSTDRLNKHRLCTLINVNHIVYMHPHHALVMSNLNLIEETVQFKHLLSGLRSDHLFLLSLCCDVMCWVCFDSSPHVFVNLIVSPPSLFLCSLANLVPHLVIIIY